MDQPVSFPLYIVFWRENDETTYETFNDHEKALEFFKTKENPWLMVQNEKFGPSARFLGNIPEGHEQCYERMHCTQEECLSFLCGGGHTCGLPC